ncbi:MAG: hypothetical protein PVI30_18300 [Myxococcales bacterium]|jgi:hypothetical protein
MGAALGALALLSLGGCPARRTHEQTGPRSLDAGTSPGASVAGAPAPRPVETNVSVAGAPAAPPVGTDAPQPSCTADDDPLPDAWPVALVFGDPCAPGSAAPEPTRPTDVGLAYCTAGCSVGPCRAPGETQMTVISTPEPGAAPQVLGSCLVYVMPGTRVRIEALAAAGYGFHHWTAGANSSEGIPCPCEGSTEPVCEATIEAPTYCGAVFGPRAEEGG